MKILLVGSGGREHALGLDHACACTSLHVAPGNPGLQFAKCHGRYNK